LLLSTALRSDYSISDPLYPQQYNVNNNGVYGSRKGYDINVKEVWSDGFLGENITLGVVGRGCYLYHADLLNRNNKSLNWNIDTDEKDVSVYPKDPNRGKTTGLLGIAAADSNELAIHGVAPEATFYCIKQTFTDDYSKIAQSLKLNSEVTDVKLLTIPHTCSDMHNSYFASCNVPSPNQEIIDAVNSNPKMIIVSPVGDDAISGIDTNLFLDAKNPEVVSVADTTASGARSYWSTRGTCIVCNAPAGGSIGPYGENENYPIPPTIGISHPTDTVQNLETLGHNAVGAGAAAVAGVIALMKEQNKELTTRDVRAIIALTSVKNDPKHESWTTNAAGFHYSDVYGFGKIDAEKCIEYAEDWTPIGALTSGVIKYMNAPLCTTRGGVETYSGITNSLPTMDFIDYAELEFQYTNVGNLRIDVISPSGTVAHVVTPSNAKNAEKTVRYIIRNFYGEKLSEGFKINISRDGYGSQEYVKDIKLTIYGYSTKPVLKAKINSYADNPRDPLPTSANLRLTVSKTNITCDEEFTVRVDASEEASGDIYDLFLRDESYSTLFQFKEFLTIGREEQVSIPCMLKNKTLSLYAESRKRGFSAEVQIYYSNGEDDDMFISPSPYAIYTRNPVDSTITIPIEFSMKLDFMSSDSYAQAVLVGVFDLDTHSNIYSSPMIIHDAKKITFTMSKSYPHAVVYMMPQWHTNYDGCTTLIQPVILRAEEDENYKPFEVPLASKCKVPKGVLSTEEIVNPEVTTTGTSSLYKTIAVVLFVGVCILCVVIYAVKCFKDKNTKEGSDGLGDFHIEDAL
jgi:hypothetical protein